MTDNIGSGVGILPGNQERLIAIFHFVFGFYLFWYHLMDSDFGQIVIVIHF